MSTAPPKPEPTTFVKPEREWDAQEIRISLSGQRDQAMLRDAHLLYGTLYEHRDLHNIIRKTIPQKFGKERDTNWVDIGVYDGHIPDDALVKYQEAKGTGLFDRFNIVEPTYARKPRLDDPWLVARVKTETSVVRYVVIATWK